MAADPPPPELVEPELHRMRHFLHEAQRISEEPYEESGPDDLGKYNWLAMAARDGLRQTQILLHGWGQDWLAEQPEGVRAEVAAAEDQLFRYRTEAMEHGARVLLIDMPSEMPSDPFEDT